MKTTKWDDRAMDTALAEALDGDVPKSLVGGVLGASAIDRRAAVDRVEAACRRSRLVPRPAWPMVGFAALLTLGVTIVFWVSLAEDQESVVGERWQDAVADPARVTPKTEAQLTKMLGQVTRISYRQCSMDIPTPVGRAFVDFDVDMEALFPIADAGIRARILSGIAAAAQRPARAVRTDIKPGMRLVLHLKNGGNVHALIEIGRTLRIMEGTDFRLPGDGSFSKSFRDVCSDANYYSMAHRGVASVPALLKQKMDGKPLFDRTRTSLRVWQCQMWEDMADLDEFTRLRSLRLSYSSGLDSRSFRRFGWPAKTRAVFGNLRKFSCPNLRISDGEVASLLSLMPRLEEVDLSNCPSIGVQALTQLGKLSSLRRVDLSHTTGWTRHDLRLLAELPEGAAVLLRSTGIAAAERVTLDEATRGRIIWVEK